MIDEKIYQIGIKGELTENEIALLPKEYSYYKSFFRHALKIRQDKTT